VKAGVVLMVSKAPLLVMDPAELVTTTVYVAASEIVALAMVNEALVPPERLAPFFLH
jgi:hypothetical protein